MRLRVCLAGGGVRRSRISAVSRASECERVSDPGTHGERQRIAG